MPAPNFTMDWWWGEQPPYGRPPATAGWDDDPDQMANNQDQIDTGRYDDVPIVYGDTRLSRGIDEYDWTEGELDWFTGQGQYDPAYSHIPYNEEFGGYGAPRQAPNYGGRDVELPGWAEGTASGVEVTLQFLGRALFGGGIKGMAAAFWNLPADIREAREVKSWFARQMDRFDKPGVGIMEPGQPGFVQPGGEDVDRPAFPDEGDFGIGYSDEQFGSVGPAGSGGWGDLGFGSGGGMGGGSGYGDEQDEFEMPGRVDNEWEDRDENEYWDEEWDWIYGMSEDDEEEG